MSEKTFDSMGITRRAICPEKHNLNLIKCPECLTTIKIFIGDDRILANLKICEFCGCLIRLER